MGLGWKSLYKAPRLWALHAVLIISWILLCDLIWISVMDFLCHDKILKPMQSMWVSRNVSKSGAPANQTSNRSFNLTAGPPSSTASCSSLIIWSLRRRALGKMLWIVHLSFPPVILGLEIFCSLLVLSPRSLGTQQGLSSSHVNPDDFKMSTYVNRFWLECDSLLLWLAPLNSLFPCLQLSQCGLILWGVYKKSPVSCHRLLPRSAFAFLRHCKPSPSFAAPLCQQGKQTVRFVDKRL